MKVIAIVGPTAVGKTALALELARRLDGEIISCDSMQIYKHMDIGTAKPTKEEMAEIPHHLIDIKEPNEDFSCADYAALAKAAINDIISRGKTPIFCGGTGLYLDSVIEIESFSSSVKNEEYRTELERVAGEQGAEYLHSMLREVDPKSAQEIHANNVKRVIRALEIYYSTGKTKTEWDRESTMGESPYDYRIVTLDYEKRDILYSRIDRRVDIMIKDGLESEVRSLYEKGQLPEGSTAAQGIGYKEMLLHVMGEVPLDVAVELIKKNTRNYAKRQITWFKRYRDISVIPDEGGMMKNTTALSDEVIASL